MTSSIKALSIIKLSLTIRKCDTMYYNTQYCAINAVVLSVIYSHVAVKSFMLSVIVLNVVAHFGNG
jgi:hypothetical protein